MTAASPPPPPPHAPGFAAGLGQSLPIALGYLPIALSFGMAATRAGLGWSEAVMLSAVIYAGASQFLALALVGSGAPLLVSAATLIAMNLRHVLYGPALMERAGPCAPRRRVAVWGWGLTDEVFGQALGALARGQSFGEGWMTGLGLGAYAAWVGGTAAGALAGGQALQAWPALDAGLGFMLGALFLALLLSVLTRAALGAIVVAGGLTGAASLVWSPTAGILAGMFGGALAGTFLAGRAR
jgi:4-azaleucine resistance transporter AzlC